MVIMAENRGVQLLGEGSFVTLRGNRALFFMAFLVA